MDQYESDRSEIHPDSCVEVYDEEKVNHAGYGSTDRAHHWCLAENEFAMEKDASMDLKNLRGHGAGLLNERVEVLP